MQEREFPFPIISLTFIWTNKKTGIEKETGIEKGKVFMANVKAFKALRFTQKAGDISELVCPPYDIISEEERREYIEKNPCNIIRLELPKDGNDPYAEAEKVLCDWRANGLMEKDGQDGLYIYEIQFKVSGVESTVSGLVSRVKLEEFSKGVVLPHEQTLSKAKEDRLNLMKATNCNFSQIYSLYMDGGKIFSLCEQQKKRPADITAQDRDGLFHRLWVVTDPEFIKAVEQGFEDKKLYIADGHHRYETALNYRNFLRQEGKATPDSEYIMMFLADMEQKGLYVLPTHRIVRGLESFDREKLLCGCRENFEVTENLSAEEIKEQLDRAYGVGKAAFGLYTKGNYDLLVSKVSAVPEGKEEQSLSLRSLDVSILHTLVLEKELGIDKENMAKQINLTYTRDRDEAVCAVDSGEAQCAFILNPTKVEEIKNVALDGEKMPQKSTYFYPKLITGLVMNSLD